MILETFPQGVVVKIAVTGRQGIGVLEQVVELDRTGIVTTDDNCAVDGDWYVIRKGKVEAMIRWLYTSDRMSDMVGQDEAFDNIRRFLAE